MNEVKPGQLRRWWHEPDTLLENRGKLFIILGPTASRPRGDDRGWRFMQEGAGAPDWHRASVIETQSEVVSE